MKERYRKFNPNGIYYVQDPETAKQKSLSTRNRKAAARRVHGLNEAHSGKLENQKIAEAYLRAIDDENPNRTRQDVFTALGDREGQVRESSASMLPAATGKPLGSTMIIIFTPLPALVLPIPSRPPLALEKLPSM